MDVKELYKKIPKFECAKGCNKCCGIVPVVPQEAKNLNLKNVKLLPHSGLTCKFTSKNGCTVYENRPLLCRLFGVVQTMACTCGGKPERLLTSEEENQLIQAYFYLQ